MFLKSLFPLTLAGFLMFGVADEVNKRFNLYECPSDYKLNDPQTEMLLYLKKP